MLCVYDHNGLFEGLSSDDTLWSDLPDDLSLVVVKGTGLMQMREGGWQE